MMGRLMRHVGSKARAARALARGSEAGAGRVRADLAPDELPLLAPVSGSADCPDDVNCGRQNCQERLPCRAPFGGASAASPFRGRERSTAVSMAS